MTKGFDFPLRVHDIEARDTLDFGAEREVVYHNGYMVTLDPLRAGRREEILQLAERRGAAPTAYACLDLWLEVKPVRTATSIFS